MSRPRAIFPGVLAGVGTLFPSERVYLWDLDGYIYELGESAEGLSLHQYACIPELDGMATMLSAGHCVFIGEIVISQRLFSTNDGFVARSVKTGEVVWEFSCQPEYVGPACLCGLVRLAERDQAGSLILHLCDPLSGVILDSHAIEDPYVESYIWLWETYTPGHVIVDICDVDNLDDHHYWEWVCAGCAGKIDLHSLPFYDVPTRQRNLPGDIDDSSWTADCGDQKRNSAAEPTYRPFDQVGEWLIYWADLDDEETCTLVFSLNDLQDEQA
ncbi:MAG: hypothetical protein Q4C87_02300 [Actinomycetaceae bacterium]|nr:hypothetical protein [Actinomycetaceae bacterium]